VGAAFILLSVPEWSKVGRLTEKCGNPAATFVPPGIRRVAMLRPDTLSLLPQSPTDTAGATTMACWKAA
jgi:hypothetical protein